ncbi:MAG: RnfABCDGE type electron transport complex subunit D [Clostridia bacterium]|nr:RnfABCDGE type electron transport complex subunit D [Clostridia bacterium]
MDNMLHVSSSPHIHSGKTTQSIMRDVLIALLPATVAGTVIFGWRSLLVVAVCVASCILLEALFNLITKKEQTVGDLSAAVTGLLLGLNLPVNIPIWQCVIGCIFAILLVKCLFGGIGNNLVNPAITARVFMLVSFGSMAVQATPTIVDTVSGATPLVEIANGNSPSLTDLFLGTTGGAIGETCALALLIGFAYLLIRRVITWHIPVSFVGSVFLLSFFMEGFDFSAALSLILSGGLLIGAIFMATDYVTSPSTSAGKLIFGLGAGLLTFVIRYFSVYPEGVSFAILFMNILNPYIEKLTARKIFGGPRA